MKGGLCGGHRSLHVDNQVPRTSVCVQLAYLGTLRSEPQESSIKLREYDRFKGFNGTAGLQWGSMASTRLKGVKAFNEVQRPSKIGGRESSDWDREVERLGDLKKSPDVAEMQQIVWKCCTKTTNDNNSQWRDRSGCCRNATSFFMALQCVAQWCTATQYLVWKKTNNFNDLTAVIRLTAVVSPLHVVAWSD